MNDEDFEVVRNGMAGCGAAGCLLYIIGLLLFIVFIVIFAMISTPNPFGS